MRRAKRRPRLCGILHYRGTGEQRAAVSHAAKTDVVFNYLGQFNSGLSAESIRRRASEPIGESQDEKATPAHALEIIGQVMDGELSMMMLHRRGDRFDAATLERLAREIETELHALIAHCTSGARGITPSDVPLASLDQSALDALPLEVANIADLYPLAPMQTGIVFHSLLGTHANAYVNQLRVDIEALDSARFIKAWQVVVAHHDVLRTGFIRHDDAIRQWVARDADVNVIEQASAALNAFVQAQIDQGFDLRNPPLMRVALIRTGEAQHHLIWTFHHALLDGWSMAQVLADVLRHYHSGSLDAKPRRFRDYIAWLTSHASNNAEAEAH
ncbi:Non-ribosomal peptide synthetase module [Candidatus Burkholderia humilis]|nr:Non-ribosomal peptide synthetase module [Candidatus Burkholderia humilis]